MASSSKKTTANQQLYYVFHISFGGSISCLFDARALSKLLTWTDLQKMSKKLKCDLKGKHKVIPM